MWPNCIQAAMIWGLSDHYPILLSMDEVDGRGFVVKEKLKFIKNSLKVWHQNHTQNLDGKVKIMKDLISCIDGKGEDDPFEDDESIGLDGINFGFVKEFWPEIKNDLIRFISEFHRNGKLTKNIKCTFIVLISKVESPHRLNDYLHIYLVERLYKIMAKVLANRLRNVIVVDEMRKSKKELLLFKVDFEKTHDLDNWEYLSALMDKCNSPCYGGIEGLQALMNSVITIGLFTRFKVESNALVAVSHLQFVGDTLLIGRKCWANV
ncbi:hypothetical protein MTR_1g035380 [Medicago truncatula]|uniref:Reverse transcriptase domain-containing protein n=1 Tax=Medicago truncatula TaxID=3880 RepID=A0A072VRP2_MEDTR|nr:hypothetical protein MTR_1g035380 [Medicago truncatula]